MECAELGRTKGTEPARELASAGAIGVGATGVSTSDGGPIVRGGVGDGCFDSPVSCRLRGES